MALILNIETSSAVCSVGLAEKGTVIASKENFEANAHARKITVLIEDLLQSTGHIISDLQAVAVSGGPGSYTGLRIGTSTAKGICYALSIPLISINTLQALSSGIKLISNPPKDSLLLPMIDARRMDVYTSLFDTEGNELLPSTCSTVDEVFLNQLKNFKNKIFYGGSGALKSASLFDQGNFMHVENIHLQSGFLAELSYLKYLNAQFEDIAYYEPDYLKEFGAR